MAGVTRRGFLRAAAFVGGAWALGCRPATGGPAPTGLTGARGTGAPWERDWEALVEAARRDGTIVFNGPPTPEVREELPRAFRSAFGVEMEYLGGRSGDLMTRVEAERSAGQYTIDAMVTGAQTLYTRA